ncbi:MULTISPECIES: DEAD/DEAH box helicase [Burkholderia]|uniref:Helicase n=1 Tax=Burkholderia contaminans TaxID=488447 RepID=A0A6P3AQR7_9BURK|nr:MULTISPECIES: DEAD/DEAH box helicase [Burkholderia]OXJ26060.1 type III restriction endonuclease subunit R [Burkholderia sp. HI2714]VWD46988.1 helicase [Burkholderia contaminans]
MKQVFQGWGAVGARLLDLADAAQATADEPARAAGWRLNDGQRASLRAIARRLPENGLIIADEVGMGKTRIAVAVARAVIDCGGRVAILVPPGLGYQWRSELRDGKVQSPLLLRSLWQYLCAWQNDDPALREPWFDERAVLISHAFANWSLGGNRQAWRWRLLPALCARWREPRRGSQSSRRGDRELEYLRRAVAGIVEAASIDADAPMAQRLTTLVGDMMPADGRRMGLNDAAAYRSGGTLRPALERAVGAGLGAFDLVIIDEAHKSRGDDSGLSRLLDNVVLASPSARRMALTATPVELDSGQWEQTLARIGADTKAVGNVIERYSQAVRRVRQCIGNDDARDAYKAAASAFRDALARWVLRRDKRNDRYVQAFARMAGEPGHAYRREREIVVDTGQLDDGWKQAVCAAESLSFVGRQADADWSSKATRLRLTMGNGHGIATLMDQATHDAEADRKQEEHDQTAAAEPVRADPPSDTDDKARQRAQFWIDVATRPFGGGQGPLYDHPAILAAVNAIEAVTRRGEKVLVFGRFTRPLRALVDLLNAREMLTCLDAGKPWPQSKLHDREWPAVQAAHRQLKRAGPLERSELEHALEQNYRTLESEREKYRGDLLSLIEQGWAGDTSNPWAKNLFDAFGRAADMQRVGSADANPRALVARAMHALRGGDLERRDPLAYAAAFVELVEATSDRDVEQVDMDAAGDADFDDVDFDAAWKTIEDRLNEEFNRPEGGFARLMHGDTKPETRRMQQLAFNRAHVYPRVLVAQSMVGREGLNLHRACRTVVLLHPEWNPAVVEQQIGRVDRLGSLWESLIEAGRHVEQPHDVPRIEFCPVVFKGTYDEVNWRVLHERWEDLRAQLHGVVVSSNLADRHPELASWIEEINDAAPNFTPPPESTAEPSGVMQRTAQNDDQFGARDPGQERRG